jgi:HAD superfamily hydrolase (TIGR01490 family)
MRSSWRSMARSAKQAAGAPRPAAFFDLDRTLMAGSSGLHFGRAAYNAGWVNRRDMVRFGLQHLRFRLRGSTDEGTRALLAEVTESLRGIKDLDLQRMAPEVLAGVLPRIYPQMLEEVHAHQDAGRPTFIVSAAADGMVRLLARVLGMDGGVGTSYEVGEDGTYTGRLEGYFMYGEGKEKALERFADEHDIDLSQSWAYSDSASDLPMLRAVGYPVAVNPDAELAEIAAAEGWQVMRTDKLGRRITIAATTMAAAAIGGMGTLLASRRGARRTPALVRPARMAGSRIRGR